MYLTSNGDIWAYWSYRYLTDCKDNIIKATKQCSNCNVIYSYERTPLVFNYCPNCGAKIIGEVYVDDIDNRF